MVPMLVSRVEYDVETKRVRDVVCILGASELLLYVIVMFMLWNMLCVILCMFDCFSLIKTCLTILE